MRRPVWVFAAAMAATAGWGACSRPTPATIGRSGIPPSTTIVETPATPVAFTVSSFVVEGATDPASVESVKAAVLSTFSRYLEEAVLTPLRSGGPAGEITPLFTARAAEHLSATGERNAFVDEGLPPAARIVARVAGLRLAGLADQNGDVVLVAARMDLTLVAGAPGVSITIDRGADLLLVADGDGWKIDSYAVRVARDTPDSSSTVVAGH